MAGRPRKKTRVGLAFGGGLPFGLVAFGVLRAFEEQRIPIARMAGTSMGSIIAAMYAAGLGIDECIAKFRSAFGKRRMLTFLLRDLSFSGSGILRGHEVMHMLRDLLGKDATFESLKIPLRMPACDLADGSEVVFESGPLIPAIRASISLPGIFEPFHYEGRLLVDGALVRPIPVHLLHDDEVELKIPVRAVRKRARRQLHDDITQARHQHRRRSIFHRRNDDLFSVLWRSMSLIMQDEFAEMVFDDFDVYVKPQLDLDLSRDPSKMLEIVQAGYDETMRTMPAIQAAMSRRRPRPRLARRKKDHLGGTLREEVTD